MRERDIAWLAGLLEGEGCFGFNGRTLYVLLHMTDRDIIERADALMDGTGVFVAQDREGRKTLYGTRVFAEKAEAVMRLILPLMGERRTGIIAQALSEHKAHQSRTITETCRTCGGHFERAPRGRGKGAPPRYCTVTCKREAKNARRRKEDHNAS